MTEARIPRDKNVWDPIDIFLFSNGQQYTPPRKYHLHGHELNLWESTLGYLAKCQLGSTTSHIHLFTLQGRKVETPLELVDGSAYVAVATTDKFIDSGYDKYIIKATRSWEKRQARKCDNKEHNPDELIENDLNVISNSDDMKSIKPPEENFTTESLINASIKQQSCRKYRIFGSTQGDKNRLSQQPSTLKKSTTQNVQPPIRRSSIKSKENPPKRFVKPLRPSTTISLNSNGKNKVTNIPYRVKDPSTPRISKIQENKTSDNPSISNNKCLVLESSTKNTVDEGKELVLNSKIIVCTEDNETDAPIILKEHVGIQQGELYIPIHEEVQTVIIDDNQTARITRSTSSKTKLPDVTSNMIVSKHKPVEDNYITFMNKGDIVSLKLMIQIKSLDNHKTVYRTVRKSQSLTNVFKPEKGLQVDTEDKILIQRQTLHSAIDNEITQNSHLHSNDKVVIISCDCGEEIITQNKTDNDRFSESSSKKYVVLVPRYEIRQDSCLKCRTNTNVNNEILLTPKNSSSICSIKKIREEIIEEEIFEKVLGKQDLPQLLKDDKISIGTFSKKNLLQADEDSGGVVSNRKVTMADSTAKIKDQIAANEVIRTESKIKQISDNSVKEVISETIHVINYTNHTPAETITKITSETNDQDNGYFLVREESKPTYDKWTQTNIDDLVFEARLHDDGHYTFHLPSLNALKTYNLS